MDSRFDRRQTEILSNFNLGENAKLFFSALDILLQTAVEFFKETKFLDMKRWDEFEQSYEFIKARVFGLEALVRDYFLEINIEVDRERVIVLSQNLNFARLEVELKQKNEEIFQLRSKIEDFKEEKRNFHISEEDLKNEKQELNQDYKEKIKSNSKWKYLYIFTAFPIFLSSYKYFFK